MGKYFRLNFHPNSILLWTSVMSNGAINGISFFIICECIPLRMQHKRIKYNNPSFATTSQCAFYLTRNITTCFGLHLSHHQVLSWHIDHSPCTDGILTFPQMTSEPHMVHTHEPNNIYIIYFSNIDTFRIWRVHTRLRSWYFICLSTWCNIRLQGYPFRHKEIYSIRPQNRFICFILYSTVFFIYVTPFLLLFLPFICLDLDVSSHNYYCIYRLQLHRFNFTKIFLAQIQQIRWNS
jgi:hypothetical protein